VICLEVCPINRFTQKYYPNKVYQNSREIIKDRPCSSLADFLAAKERVPNTEIMNSINPKAGKEWM